MRGLAPEVGESAQSEDTTKRLPGAIPAERVTRLLERLRFERGLPAVLVMYYEPEFTSRILDQWPDARNSTPGRRPRSGELSESVARSRV